MDPHIVILGGGFAGLNAARKLRKAPVRVTLVDRKNHHLFQPLLYQVATAGLSPGDIAEPIRGILRDQKNTTVRLAEVERVDPEARQVHLRGQGPLGYDYLVVATGATHNYFGNQSWASVAPGLKTLEDALAIRRRFLMAFEQAELEPDPARRRRLLTFAIVGAGPTGVELAGTMAEMAHQSMPGDFRQIKPGDARVILIQGHPRVLPSFEEDLSQRALEDLRQRGVEVLLGENVTEIDEDGLCVGDQRIEAQMVIWAAGVKASPVAHSLDTPQDRRGRVQVAPDLSLPGHPEVFVAGDLASLTDAEGKEVPGLAPAAMQMGDYVGEALRARVLRRDPPKPFVYKDKGALATIGRAAAVGQAGGVKLTGAVAWLAWLTIHLYFLIGFDNRLIVLIQWFWAYVDHQHGARLITQPKHNLKDAPVTHQPQKAAS